MRPLTIALMALLLAAPLAGCLTPPDWKNDAESASTETRGDRATPAHGTKVVQGNVGGSERKTETIHIPSGATSFRVNAMWNAGGSASFELKDPSGRTVEKDTVSGGANHAGAWYLTDSPMAGAWTFTVSASGGVNYRFEFAW